MLPVTIIPETTCAYGRTNRSGIGKATGSAGDEDAPFEVAA